MAYIPPLNGGRINATIAGNTAGAGSLVSTGTLTLAGGNNITLSQAGNAITLSAPVISSVSATGILSISSNGATVSIGAPAFSAGISSNSTVSNQLILAAGNNISLSQNTNATGATVSIHAATNVLTTARASTDAIGLNTAKTNVTWTVNSSGLSLNAAGYAGTGFSGTNATATLNSNGLQLSVGAGGGGGGVALNDGAHMISSGTASIVPSGALGVTINGQTLSMSVAQTSSVVGGGIVSLSTNAGSVTISAPAFSAGVSNLSNDSGNTGMMTNRLVLAGGNNIMLSQSTNASGATVSINATNVLTTARASTDAIGLNTAKTNVTWTVNSSGLSLNAAGYAGTGFSGTNASGTLNSNGLSLSVGAGGGGGGIALANSNTTFSTGVVNLIEGGGAITIASTTGQSFRVSVPGTSSLVGVSGISMSTSGGTISIIGGGGGGGQTLSRWEYPEEVFTSVGTPVNGSLSIEHVYAPFNVVAASAKVAASFTVSTFTQSSTASMNYSLFMGLYTLTGSTLSLLASGSANNAFSWGRTNSSTSYINQIAGVRQLTVPLAASIVPGEYWAAALISSASTFAPASLSLMGNDRINATGAVGLIGSSTSAGRDALLGQGIYTTTTNALPSSIVLSADVNNTSASYAQRAGFYHVIYNATY